MAVGDVKIRRITRMTGSQPAGADPFGNVLVSQWLPPYAELAAAGKLFAADTSAGTAKAPVVAPPTTSPEWGMYNASATESLVVLEVGFSIKSGTQGLGLAILGASALGPQTVVSADYTAAIKSCLDGTRRQPDAYITNNPTLIGGTPSWLVLANDPGNVVAQVNIGSGLVAKVDGKLIARPNGGMVAFELFGAVGTTALFTISVLFAMLDLDLY